MKPSRRVPALVLTAALGLGVWGLAFTYTPAAFSDGDVLSAAALNALLNDNFQAASDAVAGKLNLTGGTLSGPLGISSTAGGAFSTFYAENTGNSGNAALFSSSAANPSPTVSIKNLGTGPALSVASANGGPLFEGRPELTDPVTITIKAAGTIENSVGSGLPLAYGNVRADGFVQVNASTSNFTVTRIGTGTYHVLIPGVKLGSLDATSVVSVRSGTNPRFATLDSNVVGPDNVLIVRTFTAAGTPLDTAFGFVTFKPGS